MIYIVTVTEPTIEDIELAKKTKDVVQAAAMARSAVKATGIPHSVFKLVESMTYSRVTQKEPDNGD